MLRNRTLKTLLMNLGGEATLLKFGLNSVWERRALLPCTNGVCLMVSQSAACAKSGLGGLGILGLLPGK